MFLASLFCKYFQWACLVSSSLGMYFWKWEIFVSSSSCAEKTANREISCLCKTASWYARCSTENLEKRSVETDTGEIYTRHVTRNSRDCFFGSPSSRTLQDITPETWGRRQTYQWPNDWPVIKKEVSHVKHVIEKVYESQEGKEWRKSRMQNGDAMSTLDLYDSSFWSWSCNTIFIAFPSIS